jgi:hypothetical protein
MKSTGTGFSGDPQPFTLGPATDADLLPDEATVLRTPDQAERLVTVEQLMKLVGEDKPADAGFLEFLTFRAGDDVVAIEAKFVNTAGEVIEVRVDLDNQ